MLLLFVKLTRQVGRQKVTSWKKIWHFIGWSNFTIQGSNVFKSNLYERQKSSSSIWDKDASSTIHRRRPEFWKTGDMIIADVHDIENNVASEVYVKRFKSKQV